MSLLPRKIWRNYPPFFNTSQEEGEMYTLTEALRQAIEEAGLDAEAGKKMMVLLTAEGKWVDRWGSYFGVERLDGEDDETYKKRIIWEVVRPKQTLQGIKECIAHYTGLSEDEVILFEPFIKLRPTDFGAKTDTTRLAGWEYWTWAVVDVRIPVQIDEELIRRINETTKAYGVKVFITTQSEMELQFSSFSISQESLSFSETDFNVIKIVTISDSRGYTDGRLLGKEEVISLSEHILSYTTDWGEYGFGEGGFGEVPFGGRSIVFESIVYEG